MHLPRRFQLLFLLFKLLITNRSNYVPVYTLQCERTQLTRLFVKVSKVTLQTLFADTLDASSDRFVENGARLNISLADSSYQNLHRSCSFLFFVNTFTTPESNNSYREREGMSQGTSSGPNVLFDKTHDVACIIYHARGESWLYSASIEHWVEYRWITDYRPERGHPISRLPRGLETIFYGHISSLSFPFSPSLSFSLLSTSFFPTTRSACISFFFSFFSLFFWSSVPSLFPFLLLSLCRLCTRRHQSAGPIGECFYPDESSHPEARKEIAPDFVSFCSGRPPPVGRFVSHDFRNIAGIGQIRFTVNE